MGLYKVLLANLIHIAWTALSLLRLRAGNSLIGFPGESLIFWSTRGYGFFSTLLLQVQNDIQRIRETDELPNGLCLQIQQEQIVLTY